VTGKAPASSPLLGGSEPLRTPSTSSGVEDGPYRVLELARKRGAVRHKLFRDVMGALRRLGEELVDVVARLEIEGLWLVDECHQLMVAINLGLLHHDTLERTPRHPLQPHARLEPEPWRRPGRQTTTSRSPRSAGRSSMP